MAKRPAPDPPREALPDGESNRYLARVKTSLCKRWSVSRRETLYEIADLAVYLWALERPAEAVAIAASVAVAVPEPPPLSEGRRNYDVWCPATYSHALVVHLGESVMPEQAGASRAALLADTGITRDNPDHLEEEVREAGEWAAAPPAAKATKWECQRRSRALGGMVLYTELAAAGDPLFVPHATEAASVISPLLANLRAMLDPK